MDVYAYQAALWCAACGEGIRADLTAAGKAPANAGDEYTYDSDNYPKGPVADGGGEADSPQHCDGCGVFLENALTADGEAYVKEAIEDAHGGAAESIAITVWAPFYGFPTEPAADE